TNISQFLQDDWTALITGLRVVGAAVQAGDIPLTADTIASVGMQVLPVAGVLLTYLMLCRGLGRWLAVRRCRRDLAPVADPSQHAPVENATRSGSFESRTRSS